MVRSIWILMLAGSLAPIGCEQNRVDRTSGKVTTEAIRRDIGQADNTTAAYAEQTKEEYQQQLDTRLKGMDAQITMLLEKNRDLKGNAKAEWDRTLFELQAKRDSAYASLVEVRESSAEAWKDVKNGAQRDWDELDGAFRDASRRF